MRKNKKKGKLFILILLILGISLGYALLSSTLSIMGTAGINKNTWDIHWNENSIVETPGSVTAKTPAYVSNDEKTIVTFNAELELPGDFYEFTVDAKNYGTIDGQVKKVNLKFLDPKTDEEINPEDLPEYLTYTFTHDDDTEIVENETINVGESIKYKLRFEFNEDATAIPTPEEGEEEIPTPKPVIELDTIQKVEDPDAPYTITFNPNGGSVDTTTKSVERGEKIGELPTPSWSGYAFTGWYTELNGGVKIDENYTPTKSQTLYAHWNEVEALFDTGRNVLGKFKSLAGTDISEYGPTTADTNIISIRRSTTEPSSENKTEEHIVSVSTSKVPIYAWFDNGTIYWWSSAIREYANPDSSHMFAFLRNVMYIDTGFDTSLVTDMSYMFDGDYAIQNISFNWNTENVTTMLDMFNACSELRALDLSSFRTSKVTDMYGLFYGDYKMTYLNLSNWDFTGYNPSDYLLYKMTGGMENKIETLILDNAIFPTSMQRGLDGLEKATTISLNNVDTSRVTDMSYMFYDAWAVEELDLTDFDTSHVTTMFSMFYWNNSLTDLDITGWNTSALENVKFMFYHCESMKNLDLSELDTSNVTDFTRIFDDCWIIESINMSNWDFSKATGLGSGLSSNLGINGRSSLKYLTMDNVKFPISMYNGLAGLNSLVGISLKNVDTSNVNTMSYMFNSDYSLEELDISDFDTHNVQDMSYMFSSMNALTTITVGDNFVTDQVLSSGSMFSNSSNIVGGKGTTWNSSYLDKKYAHYDYGVEDPGYFNAKDLVKVTVTFDPNGGSVAPSTKQANVGRKIGDLPIATLEGSGFEGWYTGINDGTKIDENYIVNGETTYYAHWKDNKTINYNSNDGLFDNNENTNSVGYKYNYISVPKYSHTSNIDDRGVASNVYADNLSTTDVVTIPGASQIRIEVWFTTESSCDWLAIYPAGVTPSDSNYADATISNGKLDGYGSYYGYTKPNSSDPTYHRVFVVNGDTAQFYFKSDTSTGYYGYYAIVSSNDSEYSRTGTYKLPTKNLYKFIGWNTSIDGNGTNYESEQDVLDNIDSISNNTTLYAKFRPLENYQVQFNANGGSVDTTSIDVLEDSAIGELPTPTWAGHHFEGWYTDITAGTQINEYTIPNGNLTYYAHWKDIYNITLNANGGTVDTPSVDVIQGNTIGNLPTPTKTDSVFMGWYTGLTDGTKITSSYQPNASIEIYAHWNDNKTITYNANGGTFTNSANTNVNTYAYQEKNMTKYSHTPNVYDDGSSYGSYYSNMERNDIVTIPGASQINVQVWFSTEKVGCDWLAIYNGSVTPSKSNYSDSISGKLGGGKYDNKPSSSSYRKSYTITGDTAQFFFVSDNGDNYYGYYAIITGTGYGYFNNDTYQNPTNGGNTFRGWNTEIDGSGTNYASEDAVIADIDNLGVNTTLYAQW